MNSLNQHYLHTFRLHNVYSSSHSPCISIPLYSASVPKLLSPLSFSYRLTEPSTTNLNKKDQFFHNTQNPFRISCNFNDSDIISHLELGRPGTKGKPEKRVNGIYWIILLNLGIYAADHVFKVRSIKSLYLYHNKPAWYQFVTSTFCHYNREHLSSNLFFLYIFGKLVEEEKGNFGLWFSYIATGAAANLVSWLITSKKFVSVRASGAVYGLFAISICIKMSRDWRKFLEVLILSQFVIGKVMETAQGSSQLVGSFLRVSSFFMYWLGGNYLWFANHIAHFFGALVGVVSIWLLSKVPSPLDDNTSKTHGK